MDLQKENIIAAQARMKPKIEEIIPEYLVGEEKRALLDFLGFCSASGIKCAWSAANILKLSHKTKKTVGMIYIGKYPCGKANITKGWWCTHIPVFDEVVLSEGMTGIIHRNVLPCGHGIKSCGGGKTVTIYGKEFSGVHGVLFKNPDDETLNCIKRNLEFVING